jgi:hypothetical protein
MQVSQERGHLFVGKSAGESGHHALACYYHALYLGVAGGNAARQCGCGKHPVKIGRDLLETKVVFFVAMGAADLVQVLPFCLLLGKSSLSMATSHRERKQRDTQNGSEADWRIHGFEGPTFAGMKPMRLGDL